MVDKRDIAIAWLSLQIALMSYQLYKDSTARAYLQGRMDTYAQFTTGPDEEVGTCLAGKGVKC